MVESAPHPVVEPGRKAGSVGPNDSVRSSSTPAQAVRALARQRNNACDFQAMDDFRRLSPVAAALQAIGEADEEHS